MSAERPGPPALPRLRHRTEVAGATTTIDAHALSSDEWRAFQDHAHREMLSPGGALATAFAEILAAWSGAAPFRLGLGGFAAAIDVAFDSSVPFAVNVRQIDHSIGHQTADSYAAPVVFCAPPELFRQGGPAARDSDQLWLRCAVASSADGLWTAWTYAPALFPESLIPAMRAAWLSLLRQLAGHVEAWQGSAREWTPDVQLCRRRAMNDTRVAWNRPLLLHGFLLGQCSRAPEAPAVLFGDERLSYRELRNRGLRLAAGLRDAGLPPGAPVVVAIDKGFEQVVAVYGISIAGSPYVPVDPHLPAVRRRLIADQVGARFALVASPASRSSGWPAGLRLLTCDGAAADFATPDTVPDDVSDDALAYVIFTSGSTGTPKGVSIEHRAAANTVLDVNRRFEMSARDRVLSLSALSFDLSVYDLFGLFEAGGAVVMPAPHETKNPAAWVSLLERHEVTLINCVPALMQLLVEYAEQRDLLLSSSLRLVMLSGDWIPVDLPDRIRRLAPRADVVGLGGATEASIWSNCFPIGAVNPEWTSIPYGRPLANQSLHILRHDLTESPDWVPGDLYIGGDGLARGYWNDPGQTASRFITHPVSGERLYRTGDLARHLPDGNIDFLGRVDHQIKISGYRVELGEIESTLRAHPAVADAVATLCVDESGNRRLVGYVTVAAEDEGTGPDLRRYLAQHLPSYMVPSLVIQIPALPLSTNGKVDRRALPSPWGRPSEWSESRP